MEYLTVAKTADLKGCSERYIKKLCKDGKLSCNIEINDRNRPKYISYTINVILNKLVPSNS